MKKRMATSEQLSERRWRRSRHSCSPRTDHRSPPPPWTSSLASTLRSWPEVAKLTLCGHPEGYKESRNANNASWLD